MFPIDDFDITNRLINWEHELFELKNNPLPEEHNETQKAEIEIERERQQFKQEILDPRNQAVQSLYLGKITEVDYLLKLNPEIDWKSYSNEKSQVSRLTFIFLFDFHFKFSFFYLKFSFFYLISSLF